MCVTGNQLNRLKVCTLISFRKFRMYTCKECNVTCLNENQLSYHRRSERHMRLTEGKKCAECGVRSKNVAVHMLEAHPKSCNMCKKTFSTRHDLDKHLRGGYNTGLILLDSALFSRQGPLCCRADRRDGFGLHAGDR